jgi:hypothetical protein
MRAAGSNGLTTNGETIIYEAYSTEPGRSYGPERRVNQLLERRGFNRTTVAVANKDARIIWAVLRTGEAYRAAA